MKISSALFILIFIVFGISAQGSLQPFCDQQMAGRYLMSKVDEYHKSRKVYSVKEIEGLIDKGLLEDELQKIVVENLENYHDWDAALIPSELTRTARMDRIFRLGYEGANFFVDDLETSLLELNQMTCNAGKFDGRPKNNDGSIYIDVERPILTKEIVPQKDFAVIYACSELAGLWKANTCGPSFEVVERISRSTKQNITAQKIILNVLNDTRYDVGLKIMANLVVKRFGGELSSENNLFDDLKTSFLKSGHNSINAEQMAWNILAVLSTGGPISERRLRWNMTTFEQNTKYLSLNIIMKTLPILDHRSSRMGHVYSFPNDISVTCNTSKSYHFWFAAFLARSAALETGAVEPSAVAAYQAAKAYHVIGREATIGRNLEFVLNSPSGSPVDQVIRMDLAYAAAGAVYGANKAGDKSSKMNIDDIITALIKTADQGDVSALTALGSYGSSKLDVYRKWMVKFNANKAYVKSAKGGFVTQTNSAYLDFEKHPQPYTGCK